MITGIAAVSRSKVSERGGHRPLDAILAGALGAVERAVCGDEELLAVRLSRVLGHAEAGGDAETRRIRDLPGAERDADPFSELHRSLQVGAGQQEQELLAAPASRDVGLADGLP